ncbi:MAG TPA: ABC transporter permease [Pseudomonadales bacterium]
MSDPAMLGNYAKTAMRHLAAHRATALINVVGLAVGLCCFLCSLLYIRFELSYDTNFSNANDIYRISIDSTLPNGRAIDIASNAWPVADLLPQEFSQIVAATRLDDRRVLLGTESLALYQDGFRMVDANFFSIFDLPWRAGDPTTALANPDAVVLTETLARVYFGDADPIGARMRVDKQYELVVTGVVADLPVNTHLTGTVFASTALLQRMFDPPADYLDNWNYSGLHTYFVLAPGADIEQVRAGLAAFEAKHMQTYAGLTNHMRVTPLKEIYRAPAPNSSLKPSMNPRLLVVLGSVALAVLLVACVNFVNLSLARALVRGREVGVRKSVGASRAQLVLQFVGEAVLMTSIATLLALLLCELLLPALGQFAGRPLALDLDADIGKLLVLVVLVGMGTGLYPAWRLAAPSAAASRRGTSDAGGSGPGVLKSALVVFQFSVTTLLLVATTTVFLQLRHIRTVDLGFDRGGLVTLQGSASGGLDQRFDALKRELMQHPAIAAVTASEQTPFRANLFAFSTRSPDQPEPIEMAHLDVSYDFPGTYGIALLAGRDFSPDFPADMAVLDERLGAENSANFVINAAAAAAHGWTPQQAVGKRFEAFIEGSYTYRGTIVGVAADSRFEANDAQIRPTVYMLVPDTLHWNYPTLDKVTVKILGDDLARALRHIDATWSRVYPDTPLLRGFVDDDFQRVYIGETRLGDALGALTCITLLIACLGLYSLAAFNAQRRTREIGVRKAMGGSVWSIVCLLTNDFSRLVLVANLIAWPIAYVAMDRWLENFAYRIDLTPMIFIGSGLVALCIAWVTVGGTAVKAASAKPVLALRYE